MHKKTMKEGKKEGGNNNSKNIFKFKEGNKEISSVKKEGKEGRKKKVIT